MKDFYTDQGALLSKLYPSTDLFPAVIKTAEAFVDRENMAELPDTAFAARQQRMFPIYDPASTLVSAAYAKVAGEDVPEEVHQNIKVAINLFGLEGEILRLEHVIAERKRAEKAREATQKKASFEHDSFRPSPEEWEIKVAFNRGCLEARGIGKESFLETCNKVVDENFVKTTPIPVVRKVASELVEVAISRGEDFYRDIPDDLLKLAGHGYPDPEVLKAYVGARSIALPLDRRPEFMRKVAAITDTAAPSIEGITKLAELLTGFDEANGLSKYYGQKFPDPLRTVHNISTRRAVEITRKVAIAGTEYLIESTDREKAQKVACHVLGPERFARIFKDSGFTMTKLAEVLGEEHAIAFNRLMGES